MATYKIHTYLPGAEYADAKSYCNLEDAKAYARKRPNGTRIKIDKRDGYTTEERIVEGIGLRGQPAITYRTVKVPKYKTIGKYTVINGRLISSEKKPKTEYGIKGKLRPFGL